ncbi:hypothetical protein CEXT_309641 [Caerostris extrusa]|uniref:Uncharacterized protein n=1 Tax=Caerostris extrusa TaxID=172846 RepID=A0AAV4NFC6_CAEEX|nr:hypothetical protein CEXT_309641 [Caerostris extrusa]
MARTDSLNAPRQKLRAPWFTRLSVGDKRAHYSRRVFLSAVDNQGSFVFRRDVWLMRSCRGSGLIKSAAVVLNPLLNLRLWWKITCVAHTGMAKNSRFFCANWIERVLLLKVN